MIMPEYRTLKKQTIRHYCNSRNTYKLTILGQSFYRVTVLYDFLQSLVVHMMTRTSCEFQHGQLTVVIYYY